MLDLALVYQERSVAKLRYAALTLRELVERDRAGHGDDFDRAHYETFFFHLFGAFDAFLQEVNHVYSLGTPQNKVTLGALAARASGDKAAAEVADLVGARRDTTRWLWLLAGLRNRATHRQGIPLMFHAGGDRGGKVFLKHPSTDEPLTEDALSSMRDLLDQMTAFLDRLRVGRTVR